MCLRFSVSFVVCNLLAASHAPSFCWHAICIRDDFLIDLGIQVFMVKLVTVTNPLPRPKWGLPCMDLRKTQPRSAQAQKSAYGGVLQEILHRFFVAKSFRISVSYLPSADVADTVSALEMGSWEYHNVFVRMRPRGVDEVTAKQ